MRYNPLNKITLVSFTVQNSKIQSIEKVNDKFKYTLRKMKQNNTRHESSINYDLLDFYPFHKNNLKFQLTGSSSLQIYIISLLVPQDFKSTYYFLETS